MPKPKKNFKNNDSASQGAPGAGDDVIINLQNSSVAEFTQRPVPNEKQVEEFEEIIGDNMKDEEIDESLSEIYQDEGGKMVDVKRLEIKKKHGLVFWILMPLFLFGAISASAYAAYHFFYVQPGSDATAVDFYIEGKTETSAGEEFFYTLKYKNNSNIGLENARLSLNYDKNIILLDSDPESQDGENNLWELGLIPAKQEGEIKIKAMMISSANDTATLFSSLSYSPQNFSSEFKKDAYFTTSIKDIGIEIETDYITSVLVGEENEIRLNFTGKELNFINSFRVTIEPKENLEFLSPEDGESEEIANYENLRPGVWQVNEVLEEERHLPIKFKFTEKDGDSEELKVVFEHARVSEVSTTSEQTKFYRFYEATLDFEVMKSDLNLALIINGSREDQGVDFGETLNYSIVYNNRGETELKDAVIMIVLQSDFLDPESLVDPNSGKIRNNTISWSKEEIEELEVLGKNKEGVIDFSINVADQQDEIDPGKSYQIKSYAQFTVGNKTEIDEASDNRSNTIINKINSDLSLAEEIRYFSSDNIPVGEGPHPPKVGETTGYKVYWDLRNNLHELNGVAVIVKLPDYVEWNGKEQASVGNVSFDESARTVIWNIGRMPVTVYRALAEFSISITPQANDRNTIMVLLPGSEVNAVDSITNDELTDKTKAQTTKLEDDEIAIGDGIVD